MTRLLAIPIVAAILGLCGVLWTVDSVSGHDPNDGQTVRIIASLRASGSVEFGIRTNGEEVYPALRFFPASVRDGQWKRSSVLELDNGTSIRIIARRGETTRLEFGIRIEEPRRQLLPTVNKFPNDAIVGRTYSSSPLLIPAPEHEHEEEAATEPETETEPESTPPAESEPTPETDEPGDSESETDDSSFERIDGGHRDGLIVVDTIIGDPDAAVLISEYGDPF